MSTTPTSPETISCWVDFVKRLKESGKSFSIYLVNGIKLSCTKIHYHDDKALVVDQPSTGDQQMVAFHAISTIVPGWNNGNEQRRNK